MFFINHLYFCIDIFIVIFIWIPLFILNKNGRKWMIYMSLIGLLLGLPFIQNMYLADWWQPNFIFNSYIKIEDLLFGFGSVGIISSIYSIFKSKDEKLPLIKFTFGQKFFAIIFAFFIFLGSFYILDINSFWASILGSSTGAILIAIRKPSFFKYAILTGIFVCTIFLPIYLLAVYFNPQFIQNEWLVNKLSGIMFLSIPIEEFIWYIFASLGISALQEGLG
jgi:hypothetical protein